MKALILCAGKGTRLGSLTKEIPKPMIPINGKPILEFHINWLKKHHIKEIMINLHYLPNVIPDYFGNGESLGVNLHYFFEPELRDTAGAMNGFRELLDEPFLVHYGDVYCEIDIEKMFHFHCLKKSKATLVVQPTDRPHDSDVVVLGENDKILSVHHTPGSNKFGNLGNAACYILDPEILDFLPDNEEAFDFVRDIFPKMLQAEKNLFGYRTDEYMEDMGTPERLHKLTNRLCVTD